MTQTTPLPKIEAAEDLGHKIGKLAAILEKPHFPGADRAALKRWAPGQFPPLAFYRLCLRHLNTDLPPAHQTHAWMAVVWGIAFMGTGAHRPDRPFGKALAEAGYSEGRLERLLAAPADLRLDLLTSAVRFLASKGEGFDWTEGALFLLTEDAEKRETLHRRLAADFYRALPKGKE
jgi:CRISPR system Cascade subunit CasB